MADPKVRQLATFTQAVHRCGAHAEEFGDVADGKKRVGRTPPGKIL